MIVVSRQELSSEIAKSSIFFLSNGNRYIIKVTLFSFLKEGGPFHRHMSLFTVPDQIFLSSDIGSSRHIDLILSLSFGNGILLPKLF